MVLTAGMCTITNGHKCDRGYMRGIKEISSIEKEGN